MKITASLLRRHGVCADQVKIFTQLWPHGATPTPANLRRAVRARLSIFWLEQFIPFPLFVTYKAACTKLNDTYMSACAPLLDAYEAGCDTAACDTLLAVYHAGRTPLRATYEAGRVQLLAKALANATRKDTP